MNIDIYTCLTTNSSDYAEHLFGNLESLKSDKHTIRYWSIGNDQLKGELAEGWTHLGNVNTHLPPSASHASALNSIINHIPKDSDYVVVADCDIAILQRDWDQKIIDNMNRFRVECIGTPKFCHVLSVYFTWFTADCFRKIRPDFMPGNKTSVSVTWIPIRSLKDSKIYRLPMNARIVQDTGWQVPRKLAEHDYDYQMFVYRQENQNKYHLVYNYLMNGRRLLTHFSGSWKRDFLSDECQNWISGVSAYLQDMKI